MQAASGVLILAIVICPWTTDAANASAPHPHGAIIKRPPMTAKVDVRLSAEDLRRIEAGQLWTSSSEANGIGHGVGIKDIAAPFNIVWDEISTLASYVGKVPMLRSLEVYDRSVHRGDIVEKAAYTVNAIPGRAFEYFVEHHAAREKGILVFFLDYSRSSDFKDLYGKWYLEPHPTKLSWTRVYYQCDLLLFGLVPSYVKSLLSNTGISSAFGWLESESLKRVPGPVPAVAFVGAPLADCALYFTRVALAPAAGLAAALAAAAGRSSRLRHLEARQPRRGVQQWPASGRPSRPYFVSLRGLTSLCRGSGGE